MIPPVVASERGTAQTRGVTAPVGLKDLVVGEDIEAEVSGK